MANNLRSIHDLKSKVLFVQAHYAYSRTPSINGACEMLPIYAYDGGWAFRSVRAV